MTPGTPGKIVIDKALQSEAIAKGYLALSNAMRINRRDGMACKLVNEQRNGVIDVIFDDGAYWSIMPPQGESFVPDSEKAE